MATVLIVRSCTISKQPARRSGICGVSRQTSLGDPVATARTAGPSITLSHESPGVFIPVVDAGAGYSRSEASQLPGPSGSDAPVADSFSRPNDSAMAGIDDQHRAVLLELKRVPESLSRGHRPRPMNVPVSGVQHGDDASAMTDHGDAAGIGRGGDGAVVTMSGAFAHAADSSGR
jgi:hypothetical protein